MNNKIQKSNNTPFGTLLKDVISHGSDVLKTEPNSEASVSPELHDNEPNKAILIQDILKKKMKKYRKVTYKLFLQYLTAGFINSRLIILTYSTYPYHAEKSTVYSPHPVSRIYNIPRRVGKPPLHITWTQFLCPPK